MDVDAASVLPWLQHHSSCDRLRELPPVYVRETETRIGGLTPGDRLPPQLDRRRLRPCDCGLAEHLTNVVDESYPGQPNIVRPR